MANSQFPRGLVPISYPGGGEPRLNYYRILSTAAAVGIGSPMRISSNGCVYPLSATDAAGQVAGQIIGVSAEYRATGVAARNIGIWDDPDQLFLVQCTTTTVIAQTHVGNRGRYRPLTVDATKKIATGGIQGLGTTQALLSVVGISNRIDNELGLYADLIVRIVPQAHYFGVRTTGI